MKGWRTTLRIFACSFLLLLAVALNVGQEVHADGTPLSRNEHPRLGFNRADLPTIVARLSTGGEWRSDFQSYVSFIEGAFGTTSTSWDDLSGWSMGAAFIYAVRTQGACCSGITFSKTTAQYASQALVWVNALKALDTSPPNYLNEHAFHATFFVYDWIHDTLDSATKTSFVNYWKTLDQYGAIAVAYRIAPQWANEQHSRGFGRKVLAGLACHLDGIDDAWCQTSYETYTRFIRNPTDGMVSRETQRGGTDGSVIQGINYGFSYDAQHLAIVEMGWRTANGISRAQHYTAAEAGYWLGLPRLATYFQRPWAISSSGYPSGRYWRFLKDVYTNNDFTPHQAAQDLVWWGFIRRELQGVDDDAASLAAWNIANRVYSGGTDKRFWVHTKFLGAKNVEKGPDAINLPLRKAFKFGAWMWRTGWTNVNDALLTVYGYEFSGFRSAVGTFSVDYMGPAIIIPGSGGHDIDAAWHGFANSLGAPENRSTPETNDPENNDDYGFHRAYNPITPNFAQNNYGDWLDRTERFFSGDTTTDYGYLKLDRSRSMNSTKLTDPAQIGSASKVLSAGREFAVFMPDVPGTDKLRIVVSDRMSTLDTKFEKRWVLFYSGTPTVDGSATAGPARGNPASTTGKTTYTGTTTITAPSGEPTASNRTWVKPIFPLNPKVVLVNFRRNNQVEDSYGLMHATSGYSSDNAPYVGSYRTEIIPSTPQLSDHFVNVIEVGPSSGSPSTTEAISGSNFKGARVGNRVAVFATTELAPAGNFVIPTAGTYRIVVSDLGPQASRTVTGGSAISGLSDVATGATSSMTANAQGVLYLQVTVGSNGTGAENTISLGAPVGGVTPPGAPTGVRLVPQP